jgi:hypothetical protein
VTSWRGRMKRETEVAVLRAMLDESRGMPLACPGRNLTDKDGQAGSMPHD